MQVWKVWSGQRPSWLWRVDGAAWRIVAQGVANQCALLLTRPTPNADRQAWSSYSRAQPAAKQIVAACKWVRDEDSLPGRNRSLRLPEPVKQVAVESENSASLASSVPFACVALFVLPIVPCVPVKPADEALEKRPRRCSRAPQR